MGIINGAIEKAIREVNAVERLAGLPKAPGYSPLRELRAYMVWDGFEEAEEGAALVFAYTAHRARVMGWHTVNDWANGYADYTDIKAKWLKRSPWLLEQARLNGPHVIDDPAACNSCGLWGAEEINQKMRWCSFCEDQEKEDRAILAGGCGQ